MEPYDQTSQFRYNSNPNTTEFWGILEIYVHHARNIHNICIYDNQDIYAKFSLTYNPDETFSTRIINGGGKNPEFNEKLSIKITQFDAVLKCEMWMLSRAKTLMEDQLLGFSLVPISSILGKGKLTQEFSLSSTDLFHSPAGTVKLSLSLNTNLPFDSSLCSAINDSSITSEVVLLDRTISEVSLDPIEYSRIEFPDINIVRENQQMVSEYFELSEQGIVRPGSFLHLGASDHPLDDYEMVVNSSDDNESIQLSSTMTSVSDDRNSMGGESSNSPISNEKEMNAETAMQKQIVDIYTRSMQQFTESLAKMKLPRSLEKSEGEDRGNVIDQHKNNVEMENKKKDGLRIFYGSHAFF